MTSSIVVDEFASGHGVTSSDYTSGGARDVDDVIFVEEPREEGKDHVELPAVEVYSSPSTPASRQFHLGYVTDQPGIMPRTAQRPNFYTRTPGHIFRDRTSLQPTPTTFVSPDNKPAAEVKSDDQGSTHRYFALAVNVVLLAGIVFVVAVFLAVLPESFLVVLLEFFLHVLLVSSLSWQTSSPNFRFAVFLAVLPGRDLPR